MSTQLVPVDLKNYPVLAPGSEAGSLLRENLAGDVISVGDLSRIRVPAGGGTSWTVPTLDGEQSVQSIEGVILHVGRRRAYWSSADPSGDPPDCKSDDNVVGVGQPGGDCESCPLNQFGSSRKQDGSAGRGKACKETRLLFVLQAGASLPDVVVVSPGSLKQVKDYLIALATKAQVPYWGALTKLSLSREKNKDGISYARVVPTFAGRLEQSAAAAVRKYADGLLGLFNTVTIVAEEVSGDD